MILTLINEGSINSILEIELYRRKKISVKKNNGASVSFMITPLKQGLIEVKVTANSPRNQDVAMKNLLVTVRIANGNNNK